MEKIEITQENLEKEKLDSEEILLVIGGIKYKTKRSTLTKYPNTLLGRIFLNPCIKEYFLNRNGRAFHYIMELYRTGKPLWPNESDVVTCEEIEREFEYFQILTIKVIQKDFDDFVSESRKKILPLLLFSLFFQCCIHIKLLIRLYGNFNNTVTIEITD
ncbi:hypothetical protein Glove_303g145 [Diversispora epigaea]|uniref:BTB domain-containing protein n=1 Tax=Diversispora epigaea TaxID=1348612 RepID=A0A397HZV4_9GLOM|nr:hypothetical protein Glove_303g145 [Diversispora epigaea]